MIIQCADCHKMIGVTAGKRLIVNNRIVEWYFKKCKCGIVFLWIRGHLIWIDIGSTYILE